MPVVDRVAELLGGSAILRSEVRTWVELERVVREGLPRQSLQAVARHIVEPGTSPSTVVYRVVRPATFKRRAKLSADASERTERLARVIAIAESVWDDEREARRFLNRPHPLLDGESPIEVARTELGARRVERLLQDIEHGLPL